MIRRQELRLTSCERGAAIIELALIAPVFALMTIGIVDVSNAYGRKLGLEQGAQRAIEKIMQTTQNNTVEGTLTNEVICQVNGTNPDGSCKSSPVTAANVAVQWRRECTNSSGTMAQAPGSPYAASADYDLSSNACPAGTVSEADYIQVTVTDRYIPMFRIHFASINGDGTYHLSATAGMRTQ